MNPADRPRCGQCWAPLRIDREGQWVTDEPGRTTSRRTCGPSGRLHRPMDDDERRAWAAANTR